MGTFYNVKGEFPPPMLRESKKNNFKWTLTQKKRLEKSSSPQNIRLNFMWAKFIYLQGKYR
jgi:hypothetical protein